MRRVVRRETEAERRARSWAAQTKVCSGCHEEKRRDQFYYSSASKDEMSSKCRECVKGS